jgi:hypothetical protein
VSGLILDSDEGNYRSRIPVYGLSESQTVEICWSLQMVHRSWGVEVSIIVPDQTINLENRDEWNGDLYFIAVQITEPQVSISANTDEATSPSITVAPHSLEVDLDVGRPGKEGITLRF